MALLEGARVLTTSLSDRSPPLRLGALMLAAGSARRMGCNKLLLPLSGRPMIHHSLDALVPLRQDFTALVLVTGFEAEAMARTVARHPLASALEMHHNPDHDAGLASSLRCGLNALPDDLDGVLVLLGDMPLIDAELLARLLARFEAQGGERILVPWCQGRHGNPSLWPGRLVPRMKAARGDRGAGFLMRQNPHWVSALEVDDTAVLRDFDTPETLLSWPR